MSTAWLNTLATRKFYYFGLKEEIFREKYVSEYCNTQKYNISIKKLVEVLN